MSAAPLRILVVGAGALGGYFGGRLLEAGADVTFLVRPRRAAQLARDGLRVASVHGDIALPAPHVLADGIAAPFDLVLLGCKAYDLDATLDDVAPAVGPATAILPLLNGMRHLDAIAGRFGAACVLGGLCMISATLDDDGTVRHLNDAHALVFGERAGGGSPRVDAVAAAFAGARFEARASRDIAQAMWEKWVFIAALAGATCLLRGAVGDIVAAGASDAALALLAECEAVAAANGAPVRPEVAARSRAMLEAPGSMLVASMLKDVERGGRTEAEHILGDLHARAGQVPVPLLRLALAHLRVHEARRGRSGGGEARAFAAD
ncbi:2-dehydropantoate 2-reductase [Coralloluteibacterium thermophilus]|uniref:2-dehydropantoate 2-reductase n=1 Tax=Coralloluteibacterium thermophilum TaxID=2707049 RepID=A0ABV9NRL0_9GAMM